MASALEALQGGGLDAIQGGSPINVQGSNFNPQQTAPASVLTTGHMGNPAHVLGDSTTAPAGGAAAGNGSGVNSSEYLQGIQNEYGSTIANAQRQIPFYQQAMATQQQAISNQADTQTNDENNNYSANNNAYETQKQGVANQQKLSLAELADQIHGQNVGLINQLGTLGAGSSSAMGAGQNALAHVQNTNRADIQQQAGTNIANISGAQAGLLTQHHQNLDAISAYKTNTLNNILTQFAPLIQNAQTQMHVAQGEEQRLAAMYNLSALNQQATGALQRLDDSVKALTEKSLASLSEPESLSPESVRAAPAAIQAPSVSPFNVGNQGAANTTAAPTGGSLAALMDTMKQPQ